MHTISTPVKVGLLVAAGMVSFFALISYLQGRETGGAANEYWAVFSDASGLAIKSEVRVAGVPVGQVREIGLVNGKATVHFTVRRTIDVYPNAVVAKTSSSILGDNLLDLDPGFSAPLTPPGSQPQGRTLMSQPLPSGSQIRNVKEALSMEQLVQSISEVVQDVHRITSVVEEILASEKGSLREIVRNVEDITRKIDDAIDRTGDEVETVIRNAEVISENVRRLTSGKDEVVNEILANVREITEEAKGALVAFRGAMDGEGGEEAGGIPGTLAKLNQAIGNLESITAKIDRGEGTVGKLVSDERLGERVSMALEGASDYIARMNSLRIDLALRAEYLFRAEAAKNYVSLRLVPAPDKYFLFQLVDDPLGFVSRETVVRSPPGETEVANQEVRTTSDRLKFSVEMAKRYSFFSIRFGLIESTGGFGFDFHLLDDRIEAKMDVFDFARPEADLPRLRAFVNLYLIPHLFLTGGIDDALNPGSFDILTGRFRFGRDYFAGAGLFFTEEDLKVLFGTFGGMP